MAKITYITHDDQRFEVDAPNGATVMEMAIKTLFQALKLNVEELVLVLHVICMLTMLGRTAVGGPEAMEEDMLDFAWEVQPNSRLSCQVKVSDALDGLGGSYS